MSRVTKVKSKVEDILACTSYDELLVQLRLVIGTDSLAYTAKKLGYKSKASLSMFLSGQRVFTRRAIARMGEHLAWSPLQMRHVEGLIIRDISGVASRTDSETFSTQKVNRQLKLDPGQFHLLAKWYHLPLFLLLSANERFPGFNFLGKKFRNKVSMGQIMSAIYALEKLGFIKRTANRIQTSIDPYVEFSSSTPNQNIQQFHHEMLSRAQEALHEQSIKERDFRAVVFSMSPERLPEAKHVIDEFLRNFDAHFTEKGVGDICQLNVQLFYHTDSKV